MTEDQEKESQEKTKTEKEILSKLKTTVAGLSPMLSGVSMPVATAALSLVQAPTVSLDPFFIFLLAGGLATFALALGEFLTAEKLSYPEGLWHLVSIGLAAYLFVSWARYQYLYSAFFAAGIVIFAILYGVIKKRTELKKNYPKFLSIIIIGFVGVALVSIYAASQNIQQSPELIVTPSTKFVNFNETGTSRTLNVTMAAVYADARDVSLTSEPSTNLMATYLNGRENGPIEIPFLERGREFSVELRIETSPQLSNGEYNVTLNAIYGNGMGSTYKKSNIVSVHVGGVSLYSLNYQAALAIAVEIVIYLGITLRRILRR